MYGSAAAALEEGAGAVADALDDYRRAIADAGNRARPGCVTCGLTLEDTQDVTRARLALIVAAGRLRDLCDAAWCERQG